MRALRYTVPTPPMQDPPDPPHSTPRRAAPAGHDAPTSTGFVVAGQTLSGRYFLVRELARGGMGIVFEALDRKLDDLKLAVKVLPPELAGNQAAVVRMKSEAAHALKLTHPHVMRLHGFDQEGANAFLVMEFLDGPTLELELAHRGRLPLDEALRLVGQAASGLQAAHDLGIVHRDVKPANLMFTTRGRDRVLVVTDFGIAAQLKDSMTRLTGFDHSGTLLYAAPEQLQGKRPRPAADQYALAVTLYELLSGHPPFEGKGLSEQIVNASPEPIEDLDPAVWAVLARALAKSPDDRFPAISDFSHALMGRSGAAPPAPSPLPLAADPVPERPATPAPAPTPTPVTAAHVETKPDPPVVFVLEEQPDPPPAPAPSASHSIPTPSGRRPAPAPEPQAKAGSQPIPGGCVGRLLLLFLSLTCLLGLAGLISVDLDRVTAGQRSGTLAWIEPLALAVHRMVVFVLVAAGLARSSLTLLVQGLGYLFLFGIVGFDVLAALLAVPPVWTALAVLAARSSEGLERLLSAAACGTLGAYLALCAKAGPGLATGHFLGFFLVMALARPKPGPLDPPGSPDELSMARQALTQAWNLVVLCGLALAGALAMAAFLRGTPPGR